MISIYKETKKLVWSENKLFLGDKFLGEVSENNEIFFGDSIKSKKHKTLQIARDILFKFYND
jgi:hypothetical protein